MWHEVATVLASRQLPRLPRLSSLTVLGITHSLAAGPFGLGHFFKSHASCMITVPLHFLVVAIHVVLGRCVGMSIRRNSPTDTHFPCKLFKSGCERQIP